MFVADICIAQFSFVVLQSVTDRAKLYKHKGVYYETRTNYGDYGAGWCVSC